MDLQTTTAKEIIPIQAATLMLNFTTNADERKNRFSLSIGVSAGYLYSSYSPRSIYERSLDVRPFNVGFRFSYW
jgi:hypothetical protein